MYVTLPPDWMQGFDAVRDRHRRLHTALKSAEKGSGKNDANFAGIRAVAGI